MLQIKRHRPKTRHRVHKILGFWLERAHQRANLKKSRCLRNLEYEDLTFSGRFITPELVSQCTIATRVYATPEVKYLGNLALTWTTWRLLGNLSHTLTTWKVSTCEPRPLPPALSLARAEDHRESRQPEQNIPPSFPRKSTSQIRAILRP